MTRKRHNRTLIDDNHSLGHPEIDSDHLAISDCWLKATQAEPISLPFHVARLRTLMRRHFKREDSLMMTVNVPLCGCHRREHDEMLSLCDDALALSSRNWRRSMMLLRNLRRLVRDHIICMDQISVMIINTSGHARSNVCPDRR